MSPKSPSKISPKLPAAASAPTSGVPATAPGQALGFSLQYTLLTTLLLEASEGTYCSLEVLDDVAAHSADGERTTLWTAPDLLDSFLGGIC